MDNWISNLSSSVIPIDLSNTISNLSNMTTNLSNMLSISPSEIHYVKVPENHIVIDFAITDSNGDKKRGYHKNVHTKYVRENNTMISRIKNVIWNCPATIVLWTDGTKTVVKAQDDEPFDPEKGLAMAIAKKAMGNKGGYYNEFKKWLDRGAE